MKPAIIILSIVPLVLCIFCADAFAQWTDPMPVEEINTEHLREWTPHISFDGLSLYFAQGRGVTSGHLRIYEARRTSRFDPFTDVTEVMRAGNDVYHPWVSPDKLRLYYTNEVGGIHPEVSERASVNHPWPAGSSISELRSLGIVFNGSLTADELIILFTGSSLPGGLGGHDIWMATRTDRTLPFADVTNLTEINTSAHERNPCISSDGLTVYFASDRHGPSVIFVAIRQTLEEPFGQPHHLPIFDNPLGSSHMPSMSTDGTEFCFVRAYAIEDTDIWVSYRVGQQVAVDIKPGSCPNPLNLASGGLLPVAVLGTEDFDVSGIDLASVRLEGAPAVRSRYEDVAAPVLDGSKCDCNNPGPDGYTDLMLHFKTREVVARIMDWAPVAEEQLVLSLTGSLYDGTPIDGADCVVIVGKVPRSLAAGKSDITKDGIVNVHDYALLARYWLEAADIDY